MTNTYIQSAIKYYSQMNLSDIELSLRSWLSPSWADSPFKDIIIPHLINYKLLLNEQEYDN